MFGFLITPFAVGMSVGTFKFKKSSTCGTCERVKLSQDKISSVSWFPDSLLPFPIGSSKFNPKGDVILFVVLETFGFKKNVQNLDFTKSQKPRATILKLMQNIQLFHFPSLHCNPIFLITKTKCIWFSDYSFCCWNVCGNIQVQEKNCLKS